MPQQIDPKYREEAAKLAHELWSHWMKHYFTIDRPELQYERWIRLMHTPYNDLSPKEKESDIRVSEPIATLLQSIATKHDDEIKELREAIVDIQWPIDAFDTCRNIQLTRKEV